MGKIEITRKKALGSILLLFFFLECSRKLRLSCHSLVTFLVVFIIISLIVTVLFLSSPQIFF